MPAGFGWEVPCPAAGGPLYNYCYGNHLRVEIEHYAEARQSRKSNGFGGACLWTFSLTLREPPLVWTKGPLQQCGSSRSGAAAFDYRLTVTGGCSDPYTGLGIRAQEQAFSFASPAGTMGSERTGWASVCTTSPGGQRAFSYTVNRGFGLQGLANTFLAGTGNAGIASRAWNLQLATGSYVLDEATQRPISVSVAMSWRVGCDGVFFFDWVANGRMDYLDQPGRFDSETSSMTQTGRIVRLDC